MPDFLSTLKFWPYSRRNNRASREKALGRPRDSKAKRIYDVFFAVIGLIVLCPVFALTGCLIKLADGGSVFYRQRRIGRWGVPFWILKFRTMVPKADQIGLPLTGEDDRRITPFGRILRRTKFDELPQLWNVLRGEMSLVGPRPEVSRYVDHYTLEQRAILRHKPGITDLASLRFRHEETLLRASEDTERFYMEECVPRKVRLNEEYAQRANPLSDTWIILQTLCPYWVGVLGLYAIILTASFGCSLFLSGDYAVSDSTWRQFPVQASLVVGVELGCLLLRRHYRGLLCYFGTPELTQVGVGLGLASATLIAVSMLPNAVLPHRNVIMINFFTSLAFLIGFRLLLRHWRERAEIGQSPETGPPRRVAIIGAGPLGAHLAHCLNLEKSFGRTPVAFFDDDFAKWQKHIHEVPVVGMPECLLQGWDGKLDEVAITMPGASPERLQQISQLSRKLNLRVYTVAWPELCPQSPPSSPEAL